MTRGRHRTARELALGSILQGLPRGIRVGVWWNVALLALSLTVLPFDHRILLGLNPWIKPIKFQISGTVFLLTVGLLLHLLAANREDIRGLRRIGLGFGVVMIVENTIIAMQSARGVPSHMNYTSLVNGVAFGIMGVFILLNTALLAVLLALFFTRHLERPKAEVWGIRLGLAMILAGSVEGVRIVMQNGHTVGARDGGPGLPFLNWSTLHGDLRVAHFFALHALQLLWFAGWLVGRTRLAPLAGSVAVITLALVYAGVDWLLFAQALAGRSVLAGW